MSKVKKISTLALVVFVAVVILAVALTACDNTSVYSVTLDCDGGIMGEVETYTFKVNAGEEVDLTEYAPTKNGYTFGGWTDGVTIYSEKFIPTKSVTLKAVWLASSSSTTLEALKAILSSLEGGDEAFCFAFEGSGTDADGNVTGIALKASVSSEEEYTLGLEATDGSGNKQFGVYVMDGVLYVWTPDLGGIALEDFDMNYIIKTAVRLPDVLGNLMGSINLPVSMDTLLGMLFGMFTKTNVLESDTDTIYNIQINPKGLQSIASLLNLINLDSILKGAGLNIKTSGFITWFKNVLPDMDINLNVSVDKETGKLSGTDCDAVYEGEQYFDFTTAKAGFFAADEIQPVEPDVLKGYQTISLGKINLAVDLAVQNEDADLGAFINAVTDTQAVPAGALTLSSGLSYRLELNTSLDIAQDGDEDENYIVLRLSEILSDGSTKPFIAAYYKKGSLYLDVDNAIGGLYSGKGIKIGFDLKELISGVKKVVTDAIDATFFTDGRALNGNAKFDKNRVTALSGTEGNYYVSGGVLNFIQVLVGVFGVDGDKVSVIDGEDNDGKYSILNFKVDEEFLSAFLNAIGSKAEVPDFGAVDLGIKLNDDGLSSLSVDASLTGGIKASVFCDSFSIGRDADYGEYGSIGEYVDAMVGDENDYTYSVKEIVGTLLKGVSLDVGVKLSLAAGKYNIMDIISLFGLDAGEVATPWNISADSVVDARLTAELAVNPSTNKISAAVALSLNEDFNLGADKILPAGQLLAVYLSEDGTGYIDLTGLSLFGVNLPGLKANINLTSVIDSLMTALDTELKFDVSGLFGTSEEETLSRLNADGSSTPLSLASTVTAEGGEIIINSDSLKINLTLATVSALLEAFGVQFELPEGLTADLAASLDGNGLDVQAKASLPASDGYDALGLSLGITVAEDGLKTCVDGMSAQIEDKIKTETADLKDAQSNVIKALLGTVGRISVGASIDVSSDKQADLGAYVEQFVKEWLPDTDINVDIESGKVSLLVALNAERGEYAVVMTEGDGNVILSARACGETIIVTVADFGSFLLRDTGIITTIENAVNNAIESIENADLNKLFENLLNPSEGGEGETPSDPGTGKDPETPSEGGGTAIDIISLLGGISVDDAVINIDITREMIASILSALGIEADFVSAGGTIDIVDGKADIVADIGDGALRLGIGLSIGKTDDVSLDYGFASELLKAYGDEGFVPSGEDDVEKLRTYLTDGLKALGAYRSYMSSWSLSALADEYTRHVQGDGVLIFTSREDLKQYLMGLMEGVSLEADLTLDFTPGEYNILALVGKFVDLTSLGLPADSALTVSFGEPSIDLSIRFNSAIRSAQNSVDGVMALEIIANRDLALGTTIGGGEGVTIIPAGEALLAVYIRNGSLYIDVTALEVLGLNLPVFKVDDFDLPGFLYGQIDKIISGIFAEGGDENGAEAQELAMAGGDGGNISLIVARNRLELSATMSAIGAILANFLTGDAAATVDTILGALGGMEVNVSLTRDDSAGSGVYDFRLAASGEIMQTESGEPSTLSLEVGASTADIKVGDENLYDSFGSYVDGIIAGYDQTYSDILRGIADNLFKGSMLIDVDVDLNSGKYYLNDLVNNILSALTDMQGISVPIAVETGELSEKLQLALQWNLDPDTKQLKLMFEVRDGDTVLIGAYMYDGELVVDLTGVGLISIKVTNVAVIQQLTDSLMTAIDSLQGLDLNEILGGLFGDKTETAGTRDSLADDSGTGSDAATGSDNAWIAQLLGVVMLENTDIKLALSVQLLEQIIFALAGQEIDLGSDLFDLSANLGILSGKVSFEATLFGDKENALISMSVDASLSNDTIVSNAYIQAVFLRDHYELDATDNGTLIRDVLDNIADVEFEVDLSVSFKKGTYNVAKLLADFGVSALSGTQLLWTFTEDTDVTLTLRVSLKTYADDGKPGGKNGMASVEIVAKNDFNLGASNFVKAGTVLLGLYAYEDVLYLDASGIELLGITFPVFKIDFDLMGALVEKLNGLAGGNAEQQSAPVVVAEDVNGDSTVLLPVSDVNGEIVVGISEGELAITASLQALLQVLSDLNVNLGIDLSGFDLTAAVRIKDGLSIEVGGVLLPTTDGTENPFEIKLSVPSDALNIGIDVNALAAKLKDKADKYADYNDDIIETLKQTLGNNSIRAELTVDAEASNVDLNSLIAGLLKTLGVNLNIPVNISFDELYYDLEILLNWNIETRQLMLEVNMLGMVNNKTILGIYGDSHDLYIALAGLGLVDLQVKGSPLVAVLFNKLDEAIAGIDPIILSDILSDLFYGKDLSEEAENLPSTGEEGGAEELATGTDDIIRYLLSSIKITDSRVVADITSDIMSQIFRALGFDIDFVLEASLAVDLAGDKIEADVSLGGEAEIGLTLGFNGKPDRFIPSDTSKFVVLDTTNAEVDGGQVVKDFLDGFELALALDLKTNSVGTSVDSSEEPTMYTRVELKKVTGIVRLDNTGATVGELGKSALLLTLYDINEAEYYTHGSGSKTAMLHFYIDYATGKATIYLGKGYFKIVGLGITIDVTDFVSSFALQLDILGMLAPTVENLIKQVNDAANNLGQEETPGEVTPPSQDQGTTEEATGIAKVFAELDIEALLRPGININLSSTGVGNINVNFDPYELNKMVDGVFNCIFGADTIIDMTTLQLGNIRFSRNYLAYMWWDRTAASNTVSPVASINPGTPYSTWDSIIRQLPGIIDDALNGMGGALSALGGIVTYDRTAQNLHRIVKRLLPLAVWNEAEVNVNFVEGTLTNVSFTGTDTGQKIEKYQLDQSTGEWKNTGEVLTQTIKTRFNVVDTAPQAGVYTYYYEYGSYGDCHYGGKGIMHRTGFKQYLGSFSTTNESFGTEVQIYNKSSAVGDPSYTLNGTDGAIDWGNLSQNITFNPYMYSSSNGYQAAVDEYWNRYFSDFGTVVYQKGETVKRGTVTLTYNGSAFNKTVLKTLMNTAGTHTVKATAKYSDGTTSSMNISIKVKDVGAGGQDSVRTVDTVNLHVYESLPDYFTVTTYSGNRIKYYTDGSTVRLTGDYKATSPSGGTKTGYLTFANGSSYPVTINYYDSTINDQTIDLSWYDLDFTGSETTEGKDAAVQALLDNFDMYYADGSFIPELLTEGATWNTTELYNLVSRSRGDMSPATVEVKVTFDKRISSDGETLETVENALKQTVTLTLRMADKRKLAVVYPGMTEGNFLNVDPYRYYLYKVTGDEAYNPIPSTVTATYMDGSKEEIYVVTEFGQDVDWSYMNEKTVKATLKIDPTKYDGKGYFDENMQISVNLNRNIIAAVYFDEAKTQDYIVRGEKYETATVVFTNGLELTMPVAIVENGDVADVYIGFDVENYVTYGKITTFSGIGGTLLQAFTVQII